MTDKLDAIRDPAKLAASIVQRGELWADCNAAADLLEETRSTLLAKITKEHLDQPAWKAEALSRADMRLEEHIKAMVDARRLSNLAKVRYDGARALGEFIRSAESTRRAEMQIK